MKFVYRPLKDTYRATLCGLDFGPDEGQLKPGAVVEMDPNDERFSNWNDHVSGADGGRCFVPVDDSPKPAPKAEKPAKGPKANPQPVAADPSVETT